LRSRRIPGTPETVAAIQNAVRAPPTTAVGVGTVAKAGFAPPKPTLPGESPSDLDKLKQVAGKDLRVVVRCRWCGTDSVFTSAMLEEAVQSGQQKSLVYLNVLSAGDQALLEAIKETTGAAGLKASYANAAFVLANLSLVTVLVTTLGLSKSDEIGSKLTDVFPAICLMIALVAGAAAIVCSLIAIRATVSEVRIENLESVRTYLNSQVTSRAKWSRRSLWGLGIALFAVVAAFIIVLVNDLKDSHEPSGTLKVAIDPASLNLTVDTAWSGAPEDSSMMLIAATTTGGIRLPEDIAVKEGEAETSDTIHVPREASDVTLTITSTLVGEDAKPISDASKRACFTVPTTGAIIKLDKCP
jgi:hypothetical protein